MKSTAIKATLTIVVMAFSAMHATTAYAHELTFKSLTGGAQATDVWQVSCTSEPLENPPESFRFAFQIRDKFAGASKMSAVVLKDGQASTTTDIASGDVGYSDFAYVNGGNGLYTIIVNHTLAAGFDFYDLQYHCENVNGAHTGTLDPDFPIQDQ